MSTFRPAASVVSLVRATVRTVKRRHMAEIEPSACRSFSRAGVSVWVRVRLRSGRVIRQFPSVGVVRHRRPARAGEAGTRSAPGLQDGGVQGRHRDVQPRAEYGARGRRHQCRALAVGASEIEHGLDIGAHQLSGSDGWCTRWVRAPEYGRHIDRLDGQATFVGALDAWPALPLVRRHKGGFAP